MSSRNKKTIKQNNSWGVGKAREFYSIDEWGEGYFGVNSDGNIVAIPENGINIDLAEVGQQIKQQGLSLPLLVRFPQILQARTKEIDEAFKHSRDLHDCQLNHIPCYPIKVNQQRTVVEHILSSQCETIGLEVGSKTELLVALGLLGEQSQFLVCNGYKDRAYIRLALYAQCMGINVFIVIENPSELLVIKQESERLDLMPNIGLRLKLNTIAQGNWQNSGGRDAKFGLDAKDILYCLDKLSEWNCQAWLKLIHFHMGSQLSNLDDFALGLQEALHIFGELHHLGFELKYIDVGGGLAIDYASRHDASYFSRSYSIQEYADVIVKNIKQYCHHKGISIPIVLTENGRAISAHHAMLITNVVKVREHEETKDITDVSQYNNGDLYKIGQELLQPINDNVKNIKAQKIKFESKLNEKLLQGDVNLTQKAWAEHVMQACESCQEYEDKNKQHVSSLNAEKYYCNFSVFQSMPDVWGLGQIFPVMPLSRLNEQPLVRARLHDLTCDSDGKIEQYAYNQDIHDYLMLHELSPNDEYLLGFFLLGAYQEVLGDIHNLFGDTHSVNVVQDELGAIHFSEIEVGDCVNELLSSIHLEGVQIVKRCQERLQQSNTTNVASEEMLEEINDALYGYTYLDSIDRPSHRIKT